MPLDDVNALDDAAAARELLRCCGSTRWARRMTAARPLTDAVAMMDGADAIWWSLDAAAWLRAFSAHPKIGGTATTAWSSQEQAGVAGAGIDVTERLAIAN